jgi:hypothetical protein
LTAISVIGMIANTPGRMMRARPQVSVRRDRDERPGSLAGSAHHADLEPAGVNVIPVPAIGHAFGELAVVSETRAEDAESEAERDEPVAATPVANALVQRAPDPDASNAGAPPPSTPGAEPPPGDPLNGGTAAAGSTTITIASATRSVSAGTLSELWDVLTRSGTREAASVQPKLAPPPQYEYSSDDRVTKATVTVVEHKEMPVWKEADTQCPPIKNEWTRVLGVLEAHENKHIDIDKSHYANVHMKLVGKKREDAWAAMDAAVASADAANHVYDTQSQNGAAEGAKLNTAVQCAPEKVKGAASNSEDQGNVSTIGSFLGGLMPKLAVGAVDDPLEREADAAADRVMRGEPASARRDASAVVQRCTGPGQCECDNCKKKEEEVPAAGGTVRRDAQADGASSNGEFSDAALGRVDAAVRSGGRPLDDGARADMETHLGHDFSRVRIHDDASAAESASMVRARAYTLGSDIVFARGEYAPGTTAGRRLLAHELTHVVQQGMSPPALRRDPAPAPTPAAGAKPSAVDNVVNALKTALREHTNGARDAALRVCMEAGGKFDEVAAAWKASPGGDLLKSAQQLGRGTADGARVYAYLRFGELRLADKLFFAGIDAGTDKETIWRLLPAVNQSLAKTDSDFTESYSKSGGTAFGEHYTKTAKLPDGKTDNHIAGFLKEEADTPAEAVKFSALVAFGKLRPVDEIKMAIESVHLLATDIMAALDLVAKETPPGTKPEVEALYKASYDEDLLTRLKPQLGEQSDNFKKADKILKGEWTPKNRILWACEGVGTNMKEIWAALDDASKGGQLAPLKAEWDKKEGIYPVIMGELQIFESDRKRIQAILANESDMMSRLAQLGLDIDDTKGVLKAALERDDVYASFKPAWAKREEKFYKDFTQDGKRGTVWGDAIADAKFAGALDAAIGVNSEEGVARLLGDAKRTDAERKAVRDNPETMASLRKFDSYKSRLEMLLAPRDDLRARADFLRARFEHEAMSGAGLGASAASAYAFEDEYRALDVGLSKVKDPHNLTPDERKKLDPALKGTEEALESFIRVRDEMDAVAVQVAGVVGGLLATAATGGAAGPMVASLLARTSLAQGAASIASVWVVKGERITGAEGLRAFASGAAGAAAGAWAAAPIMKALSPEMAEAIKSGSREVAEQVATKQFSGTGLGVMKSVAEGGISGAAGSAVESASQQDTWRLGFVEGLKKVLDDSARAALAGAAMSGGMSAADYLKVSLFGGSQGSSGSAASPDATQAAAPPARVEPSHVERAKTILQSGSEITFERWQKEILPAFGGHAPVAREALGLARRQMLQAAAAELNPVLQAKGVELRVPEHVPFDRPVALELVPLEQSTTTATGGTARTAEAQTAALEEAAAEVHKKLGSSEASAGINVRSGPTSKSTEKNVLWEVQYKLRANGETHELKLLADGRLIRCSAHCEELALRVHSQVKGYRDLLKGTQNEAEAQLTDLEGKASKVAEDAKKEVVKARMNRGEPGPEADVSKGLEERATEVDNKLADIVKEAAPVLKEQVRGKLDRTDQAAFDVIEKAHGIEKALHVFSSPLGERGPGGFGRRIRRNIDGPASLGDVERIATAAGVKFPDPPPDIRIRLNAGLKDSMLAKYRDPIQPDPKKTYTMKELLLQQWHDESEGLSTPRLEDTIKKRDLDKSFPAIVIDLHPAALESNEAIAAALGHELHEINGLVKEFKGGDSTVNGARLIDLIGGASGGTLHVEASALEVNYIDAVRAGPAKK